MAARPHGRGARPHLLDPVDRGDSTARSPRIRAASSAIRPLAVRAARCGFSGSDPPASTGACRSGCIHALEKRPGGAEIELSLLFADVRGSTALAEKLGNEEFMRLLARFYATAATVVDARNGIVDKFVGDEVVALFIPGFAGADHAADAVALRVSSSKRRGTPEAIPGSPSAPASTSGARTSAPSGSKRPSTSPRSATPSTLPPAWPRARARARSSSPLRPPSPRSSTLRVSKSARSSSAAA